MSKHYLTMLLPITLVSAALLAVPAIGDTQKPTAARLSTSADVKLKQRLGYYVECRYTGLGEECYYVYAKPKGSNKLERIKVKDAKLMKKGKYWIECHYTGLGQECNYVYATKQPKS
jgi:hypothetical protein